VWHPGGEDGPYPTGCACSLTEARVLVFFFAVSGGSYRPLPSRANVDHAGSVLRRSPDGCLYVFRLRGRTSLRLCDEGWLSRASRRRAGVMPEEVVSELVSGFMPLSRGNHSLSQL